ncbi:MAG: dTDP-glucose 4,6-dehydratase [Candidatus Komeilibacteria bacterium CG11_big_fil_rev_8_21_14_0_20_36_20]|uniref:dTDP-glucose 4,6-dehydratase n=1 Tax=Candidatus Komeilibacteria bacterium CG11_big_fil_rev_8_21_14_0_20_36_20 TaxID=1974477 RepID=A0A2H0NC15_9BACT|nr:MAG: dTDP-glucose 4,6-dehydratase [Candidatus Komeilibacteria bacterium CG11_big_fil_rev_8_21_14_0_20_36_20]PIR82012.1 MAG: dTDP-glucose 4,6-dehydratase [Candidatus Komeilibacteria bacterium CG10_big_fil_rev_8_21_14_0_10_36_65]PJC55550.1 MAG: dTDP-glucose 4,6-dehydratase [Candidatus Komeilibacteria bacterium CG_4_9_14_0_2_um_filter_36_13]
MNILVTGGAGFIGSNFIHYILDKYPNYKLINLDLLTYAGNLDNLKSIENNPNYVFIKGDINDYKLVSELIKKYQIDLIVHFAAESHVDRSISGPDIFLQTNILGTANLLKAALDNNKVRFHQVSTDEVFGSLGKEGYFSEGTVYNPSSPYAASKASADHLVRAYHHTYGLPITISNCSNNYGPYQFPEKILPLFITNLLEKKKMPLYGDGQNIRDWLYVEDHCRALDLIIHRGKLGETYCLGGEGEMTNKQIAGLLLEKFKFGQEMIEYVTDRPGHDYRYAIDFSKIKKALGWQPTVNFSTGLDLTIEWYQNHQDWWRKLK